jgi:hypothetical protein
MFCKNCGAQMEEGAKFCSGCGRAVLNASPASAALSGQTVPPVPAAGPVYTNQNPVPQQQEGKNNGSALCLTAIVLYTISRVIPFLISITRLYAKVHYQIAHFFYAINSMLAIVGLIMAICALAKLKDRIAASIRSPITVLLLLLAVPELYYCINRIISFMQ